MIKKQYEELYKFLVQNQEKKVREILPMLTQLVSSKNQERTYLVAENGEIFAIFCYYHRKWELIEYVGYGKKASTATGLNTMCREGVKMWTRQHNEAKKMKNLLLAKVASGQISSEQLNEELKKIEEERRKIVPLPKELERYSYASKEEAIKHYMKLKNNKPA